MSLFYCSRCKKVGCRGFTSKGDFPNYNSKWTCVAPDPEIPREAHADFQKVYDKYFASFPPEE